MKRQVKLFLALLALCMVVEPYLLQTAYLTGELDTYLSTPIPTTISTDWYATFDYYNTSGNALAASLTESYPANSTMKFTLAATAQDTGKSADIYTILSATTNWNATAFDTDNAEYICAVGVTIQTPDPSVGSLMLGFYGLVEHRSMIYDGAFTTVEDYTDADAETVFWLSPATLQTIHEDVDVLANYAFFLRYREADADELINGGVVYIKLTFYSGTSLTNFYQLLMWVGLFNLFIAFAMTSSFNPTGTYRPRRRYSRKSFRRRSFRRPRYRKRSFRRRY